MSHLTLIKFACIICLFSFGTNRALAQVKATTASGNRVLLFDNGTWKYDESEGEEKEESKEITENEVSLPVQNEVVATPIKITEVKIDRAENRKSDSHDLFFVESPRLVRFFGPEKGRINCKSSAQVVDGEVVLCLEWQAQVGDANRYFGTMKKGETIDIELEGGEIIPLTYTTQFEAKYMEKYSLSIFKGGFVLTQEQINLLSTSKIRSCVAHWKKKDEEYKFNDGFGVQKALKNL